MITPNITVTLIDRFRPFASKLIAAGLGYLATYIANKYNFIITQDQLSTINEIITGWLFLTLAHTSVSKWTNPSNSASSVLAVSGKIENTLNK